MGSYLNTHIGCYIKAKHPIENSTKSYSACSNKDCSNHTIEINFTADYCPKCGNKIQQYKKEHTRKVTWYDISDKSAFYVDAVFDIHTDDDYMILLPNQHKYIPQKWNMDESNDTIYIEDLKPETITQNLESFKELIRPVLYLLKKECGEENVSIHWGILQYYS